MSSTGSGTELPSELFKALELFKMKVYWLLGLLIVLLILYVAREAVAVLFVAFIFASALLPLVERLDDRMPRWLAVLIPYTFMLAIGIGIVLPAAGLAYGQLQVMVAELPRILEQSRDWLNQWAFFSQRYPVLASISPERIMSQLSLQNGAVFSGFTGMTMAVSQVALDLLSALVISIFLLIDRERIQQYLLRFRPAREHESLGRILDDLIHSTGGYVAGTLLFMLTFGILITLGLYIVGVPFAVLLGFFTGVMTIIPILGANLAMLPALVIAFLAGGWMDAVWTLVVYIGVQMIANNVIGPLIMGRAVGLHPVAILLALIVGGVMFGMPGIILAIPMAACLNIVFNEWFLDPEHRRDRRIQLHGETVAES